MRFRTQIFVCVSLCVCVGTPLMLAPLGAQYNPPGDLLAGDLLQDEKALRASLDDARWRWGALRLEPWIGLSDVSFVTGAQGTGETADDLTATLGAGVRGYLKTGPNVIWAAHALPEYVWWQDEDDKARLNGRYGVGLFAFTNRLDLEASARRHERQGYFSSELQSLTTTRSDSARLALELALTRRLYLAASGEREQAENREAGDAVFSLLDRKTATARALVGYRSPRGWWIGAGLEESTVDFDDDARDLSNEGQAGLLDAGYEGPRFTLRLRLERRSLEPSGDSDFVPVDLSTGLVETQWDLHRSVRGFLYGRRQLAYSIRPETSNFVSGRYGARLDISLRGRGPALEVAVEAGEDDYEPAAAQALARVDDVTAFGVGLRFELRRALKMRLGLTQTDYDSNVDAFDRDVTAWSAVVEVSALQERFRLGDGEKIW